MSYFVRYFSGTVKNSNPESIQIQKGFERLSLYPKAWLSLYCVHCFFMLMLCVALPVLVFYTTNAFVQKSCQIYDQESVQWNNCASEVINKLIDEVCIVYYVEDLPLVEALHLVETLHLVKALHLVEVLLLVDTLSKHLSHQGPGTIKCFNKIF